MRSLKAIKPEHHCLRGVTLARILVLFLQGGKIADFAAQFLRL